MKRYSTSLAIGKRKLKNQKANNHPTREIPLDTNQMAMTNKTDNNKCGQECEEIGILTYCGSKHKRVQLLWKTV